MAIASMLFKSRWLGRFSISLAIIIIGMSDPVAAADGTAKRTLQEILSTQVSIRLDQVPLREALSELSNAAGTRLQLNESALKEAGIDLDSSVTLNVSDAPLREAMPQLVDFIKT